MTQALWPRSGPRLLVASAFSLVAVTLSVPAARAAPAPRITATSGAPLVAAAGDRISVSAKLVGTGRRDVIGLVFGPSKASAVGGLVLGGGVTVKRRGIQRVLVTGRVPGNVPTGELGTLLVCVDPVGAVKGKGVCRVAARIATSGTSAQERIDGALRSGRLSTATA